MKNYSKIKTIKIIQTQILCLDKNNFKNRMNVLIIFNKIYKTNSNLILFLKIKTLLTYSN
jgi:hypothetical protein